MMGQPPSATQSIHIAMANNSIRSTGIYRPIDMHASQFNWTEK